MTVTLASRTTAPLGSVTVPTIVLDLICAKDELLRVKARASTQREPAMIFSNTADFLSRIVLPPSARKFSARKVNQPVGITFFQSALLTKSIKVAKSFSGEQKQDFAY